MPSLPLLRWRRTDGGKFLNILLTALLRLAAFFSGLSERVFVEVPLHTASFVRESKRSTTSVPIVKVLTMVVADPNPPPRQRQPPPKPL